jgi:hypothetical protein
MGKLAGGSSRADARKCPTDSSRESQGRTTTCNESQKPRALQNFPGLLDRCRRRGLKPRNFALTGTTVTRRLCNPDVEPRLPDDTALLQPGPPTQPGHGGAVRAAGESGGDAISPGEAAMPTLVLRIVALFQNAPQSVPYSRRPQCSECRSLVTKSRGHRIRTCPWLIHVWLCLSPLGMSDRQGRSSSHFE